MRTFPTGLAAICLVLLAMAGCESRRPPQEANATTGPVEETSTPPAPAKLPGDIEASVAAALARDRAMLHALLASTDGPCVVDPPAGIFSPPVCPSGVPAGTAVAAIVFGNCPDMVAFIDRTITFRVIDFDPGDYRDHLIGVVEIGTVPMVGYKAPFEQAQLAVRYAALFGSRDVSWLGFNEAGRLIGAGGGFGCASADLKRRLSGNDWLRGPDWLE